MAATRALLCARRFHSRAFYLTQMPTLSMFKPRTVRSFYNVDEPSKDRSKQRTLGDETFEHFGISTSSKFLLDSREVLSAVRDLYRYTSIDDALVVIQRAHKAGLKFKTNDSLNLLSIVDTQSIDDLMKLLNEMNQLKILKPELLMKPLYQSQSIPEAYEYILRINANFPEFINSKMFAFFFEMFLPSNPLQDLEELMPKVHKIFEIAQQHVHNHPSLCSLYIYICSRARDFPRAREVVDMMIRNKITPSNDVLIWTLKAARSADEAMQFCNELEEVFRVSPNLMSFNILLKLAAELGNEEMIQSVWAVMISQGFQPNFASYSCYIRLLLARSDFDKALQLLEIVNSQKLDNRIECYIQALEFCNEVNNFALAENIFNLLMSQTDIQPEKNVYELMLQAALQHNDWVKCKKYSEMAAQLPLKDMPLLDNLFAVAVEMEDCNQAIKAIQSREGNVDDSTFVLAAELCVKKHDVAAGKQLLAEILRWKKTIAPSITHLLIKLFHWDQAQPTEHILKLYTDPVKNFIKFDRSTQLMIVSVLGKALPATDGILRLAVEQFYQTHGPLTGREIQQVMSPSLSKVLQEFESDESRVTIIISSLLSKQAVTEAEAWWDISNIKSNRLLTWIINSACSANTNNTQFLEKIVDKVTSNKSLPEQNALWEAIIRAFGRMNKPQSCTQMFKMMQDKGFAPRVYTYNVYMAALSRNRKYFEALQVVDDMLNAGVKPDMTTIAQLSKLLHKMDKPEASDLLLERVNLLEATKSSDKVAMALLHVHQGDLQQALDCIKTLKRDEVNLVNVYTHLITELVRVKQVDKHSLFEILKQANAHGVVGDTKFHCIVIDLLVRERLLPMALQIYNHVVESKQPPTADLLIAALQIAKANTDFMISFKLFEDATGYSFPSFDASAAAHEPRIEINTDPIYIDHDTVGHQGDELLLDSQIWKTLTWSSSKICPTVDVYISLFKNSLPRITDKRYRLQIANSLWSDMIAHKITPDVWAYAYIIRIFATANKPDVVFNYFTSMVKSDLEPFLVIYEHVFDVLGKNNSDRKKMLYVLKTFAKSRVMPTSRLYQILTKVCLFEPAFLVKCSRKFKRFSSKSDSEDYQSVISIGNTPSVDDVFNRVLVNLDEITKRK